jgi:hypothetical protein
MHGTHNVKLIDLSVYKFLCFSFQYDLANVSSYIFGFIMGQILPRWSTLRKETNLLDQWIRMEIVSEVTWIKNSSGFYPCYFHIRRTAMLNIAPNSKISCRNATLCLVRIINVFKDKKQNHSLYTPKHVTVYTRKIELCIDCHTASLLYIRLFKT